MNFKSKCEHKNISTPVQFDSEAAKGLSSREIRKRWPRGHNVRCLDCGEVFAAMYASYEHYLMGDW